MVRKLRKAFLMNVYIVTHNLCFALYYMLGLETDPDPDPSYFVTNSLPCLLLRSTVYIYFLSIFFAVSTNVSFSWGVKILRNGSLLYPLWLIFRVTSKSWSYKVIHVYVNLKLRCKLIAGINPTYACMYVCICLDLMTEKLFYKFQ